MGTRRSSFAAAALALVIAAGIPAALAAAPGGCTDPFGNPVPCMPDMFAPPSVPFPAPRLSVFGAGDAGAPAGAAAPGFPGMPDFGALLAGPCGGKCGAGEFCDASGACRADTCENQHKYGCPDDTEALRSVACPAGSYTDCWATAAFKCYKGASANSVSCASKGGAATSSSTTSNNNNGGGNGGAPLPAGMSALATSAAAPRGAPLLGLAGAPWARPVWAALFAAMAPFANAVNARAGAFGGFGPNFGPAFGAGFAPGFGAAAGFGGGFAEAMMKNTEAMMKNTEEMFKRQEAMFKDAQASWDDWESAWMGPQPGAAGAAGPAFSSSSSSSSLSGDDADDCRQRQRAQCAGDESKLKTVACPAGSSFTTCYESRHFKCYVGGGGKSAACALAGSGKGGAAGGAAWARASSSAGGAKQTVSASRRRA